MTAKKTLDLSDICHLTTASNGPKVAREQQKLWFWRSLARIFRPSILRGWLYPLCAGFAIILILMVGSLHDPTIVAAQTPGTVPSNPDSLMRCRIAVYMRTITDFDFAEGTFYSDFWLNGNCNNPDAPTTENLYFWTAKKYDIRSQQINKGVGEGSYWYADIQGLFRQDWDLRNFPFDRHKLQIFVENTYPDATQFLYEADQKNSLIHDPLILEDGWQITNFSVDSYINHYKNNFADPRAKVEKVDQSNIVITIDIQRTSYLNFIKLVGGVYIAFAVCAVCFLLDVSNSELYSGILGLLVGALFAVFVNQQAADTVLGITETLTLIDQIHIITMFYILLAIVMETFFFIGHGAEWNINIQRVEQIGEVLFVVSYVLINIVLISVAYSAG